MSFFGDIWKFVSGTGTGTEDNTLLKNVFYDDSGSIDYAKTAGILGAIGGATGVLGSGTPPPVGYQGKIPKYQATRSRVANTYDPLRRPGSGGQRYFSDMRFTPKEIIDDDGIAAVNPALETARTASDEQALGLAAVNLANPARQASPAAITPYTPSEAVAEATTGGSGVVNLLPAVPDYTGDTLQDVASRYIDVSDNYISPYSRNIEFPIGRGSYAAGGIAKLREGRYLSGSTDGMADKVPAEIDQVQPAALSDGEYVIPADVVSHLGNGNSDAGAKVLDEFLVEVREARTGNGKQGKEIDPKKLLPKVA